MILTLVMFGTVAVIGTVMIIVAVVIRRTRMRKRQEGPGGPGGPTFSDPWHRFCAALAAVYAWHEWDRTRGARRWISVEQSYYGYGCALTLPALRASLRRDWRVTSSARASERIAVALQALEVRAGGITDSLKSGSDVPAEVRSQLAFDIARFANLVRWCGSAGFIMLDEAVAASERLGAVAAAHFDSWDAFGEHYIAGLRQYSRMGNRPFIRAVERLLSDVDSPWRTNAWAGGERQIRD